VPFITAGDPDVATSLEILKRLPQSGADVIEIGVPFSDPMADGPAIQASSLRALNAGMTVEKTLALVRDFRAVDDATPIVLMGYLNPVHAFGILRFTEAAAHAGVDGLITVDLPPEEDSLLREPAARHGLDIVRLATPTTDGGRLETIASGAGGFLYYVSVAGVTGTKSSVTQDVKKAVARLKARANIPVAVGFGIRTPEQAREIAAFADGVAVGSAIVARVADGVDRGLAPAAIADDIAGFCARLAEAVHSARRVVG